MVTLSKLVAYLSLDKSKYEDGLKEANHDAEGFGSKLSKTFGTVAKLTGAAVTTGAAAIGGLVKQSVDAYGAFQQLEGGIETLFGNDAQTMMNNASEAFKTAGVSANQYMEMAIQSSASMISALGGDTEEAARLMDMSIIDMSDNVNKMGTTMEAVQNAYRGFSRGNFTMLDNLALGYAGTKEGMEELLEAAKGITGVDYSIDSYADMVQAIHVIQTEMGITGTTAKEAGDTITGSAGAASAAWNDMKVAIASGDDKKLTKGIDNLIASITVMGSNIIPIVERALVGVGSLIEKIVPIISEKLPSLVENILPGLLSATTSLIDGVVKALPSMITVIAKQLPVMVKSLLNTIKTALPMVVNAGKELIKSFADGMDDSGSIIDVIIELIDVITETIVNNLPEIISAGIKIIGKLVDGIMSRIDSVVDAIIRVAEALLNTLLDHLPEFLEKGAEIILKIVEGITEKLPDIVTAITGVITRIIKTVVEKLPEILKAGVSIVVELAKGLVNAIPQIIAVVPQIIQGLIDALASGEIIEQLLGAGFDIIETIFDGFLNGDFLGAMFDLVTGLLGAVAGIGGKLLEIGGAVVSKIFDGIKNAWDSVSGWVAEKLGLIDKIEGVKGNASVLEGVVGYVPGQKATTTTQSKSDAIATGNRYALMYGGTSVTVNVGGKTVADTVVRGQTQSAGSSGGY